jgi:recombination protein RecA
MVGSMADMQRASAAKLLSKFCRKTCGAVPVNDIILAGITHIQSNVSGYGAQYTEKSGNSLLYQVDLKLWAKSVKPWRLSDQGAQIGQLVEWTCTVSGSDIPPGSKTTSYIRYGCGIDMITELLVICCDLGIVKKSASWLKFEDGTQAQGMENARTIVLNTPGLYENLYSKVKEIIKLS